MPVSFLSNDQRENYGRYVGPPSPHDLARYFHLDDTDHALIAQKRGAHNRLGFAVQLGTVRYLGTFLEDPLAVPLPVLWALAKQLRIEALERASAYSVGEQRWQHATEIRASYGYVEFTEPLIAFRLTRWLYALCWTGTDRPSVLFERATTWLVTHKVLLPGCTTLERYVARLRSRVEERLWRSLGNGISLEQQTRLEGLLVSSGGTRNSPLDRLRTGPVVASSRSMSLALMRLQAVRELGIRLPAATRIPATRVAALARFAGAAKASAILRLPVLRRLATLVAFVHCLEASAQDDALEVLEVILRELFGDAVKADRKSRLRSLKDLDEAAATLASACQMLLDDTVPDAELRKQLFARISPDALALALAGVNKLIRPTDNVYYQELDAKYKTVRRFLPALAERFCRVVEPRTDFFMPSMPPAYTGRTCPANAKNWSANDMGAASSMANWLFRIMCINSMPASTELADRNDLKLSIGLVTRLMARWSCSTMLLRYLTWRTKIGTSRPALIASIAALLAPLLSIATLPGSPFAPMALSKKRFAAAMSRFAVSRKSTVLPCLSTAR